METTGKNFEVDNVETEINGEVVNFTSIINSFLAFFTNILKTFLPTKMQEILDKLVG